MLNKIKWFVAFIFFFTFSTTLYAQFENCNNGVDDDGDGKIDCFDSNCNSSPFCQSFETNCTDGVDNDGDGLPDCLDSDCLYSGACPVETDCTNGIDDDGDGFFDFYDGDCLESPSNPNSYITNVADCEVKPQGNIFDIEKEWDSPMQTSATRGMFALADVDNDGTPEVVSFNDETGYLYVLDGKNGSIEQQRKITNNEQFSSYPTVGDVNKDGYAEIFHIDRKGKIRAYTHDLNEFWSPKDADVDRPRVPLLADFDYDGVSELYYVNEIRNAVTGDMIIEGSHGTSKYSSGNDWNNELAGVPVAVDILPDGACGACQGLELVLGHVIYAVDIPGKTMYQVKSMDDAALKSADYHANGYRPKRHSNEHMWSSTSVVDYNQDGYLDVISSGTTGSLSGPTTIFFWDLHNDEVKTYIPSRPLATIPAGFVNQYQVYNGEYVWSKGVGALNIANIDSDPELECSFMSGSTLYALDESWSLEWANYDDYWEGSSGFTSTAVFDFDGNGASEIVYRDEINLYIVDGTTGKPLNQFVSVDFCSSNTHAEYPIVADVDGDGETEIIVVCGRDKNEKFKGTKTGGGNQKYGFVRAYKAANNNYWVPSRKLWNQFVYFNVNINDNLTIPRYQQPHHLSFAQKCNLLGGNGPKFSLNKFYNQSPVINYCGNLTFPSPNLEFADNPIQVNPPTCPDDRFQVRLRFINTGDQVAFKDIPVSFYADDPSQSYSNSVPNPFLETVYINIPGGLKVDQLLDTTIWVNGKAGDFTLFASLNDIGPYDLSGSSLSNETFYPMDSLNGIIRECDGTPTIVNIDVNPYPFNTTAVLLKDNDNCPGSYNSNGAITAHVAGDTLGYVFRWFKGSSVTGSPEFIGATQKGLTGGKYTVVATHTLANCTGNSSTVDVRDLSAPPVIDAEVLSLQRSCDPNNPSGELTAYVLQGSNKITAGYNFFWYKGQNTVVPARTGYTGGANVDQLSAGIYRLVVEQTSTGCTATMDVEIQESITDPQISLISKNDQTVCDPANYDGQASVDVNGNVSDYDFYWFNGNVSSPDTTSSSVIVNSNTINGLRKGTYTVFAADKYTRCLSDPLTVKIKDKTWKPVVVTEVVNPQQACDLSLANGSLRASVDESTKGGSANVTTGYAFEWYFGNFGASSLPATPTASGSLVSGLVEGPYTLVTRSIATGCQTISYISLPAQKTKPVLDTPSVTHTDNCTDPWGSEIVVSADGGLTSADGYTFQWRRISDNTILAETSETLSNIPPGEYGIRVTNPLGCTSLNEVKVTIKDEGPKPVVSLQTVPNSSCDPAQPNGILIAKDFAGNATDYTFEWFTTNLSGTQLASANDTVIQVAAGQYALRITSNTTQCFQVAYANVGTQPGILPTLDTLYTTATADCRPAFADGEAAFYLPAGIAQLPPDFTEDRTYTFEIYSGTTASGSPVQTNNNGVFSGLNAGPYTAVVIDDYNHCQSPPMTIEIPKAPGITVNLDTFTPSSACASSDGALGISVSSTNNSSPAGAGYTFLWYYRNAGDPLPGTPNPGTLTAETGFTSERIDLPSGYYTIEIYDNFSNCIETAEFFLPNADPPQVTSQNVVSATQCSPGDGSIYIEVTSPSILLNLFQVFLYEGNTIDPGNHIQVWTPLALPTDDHTYEDLTAGNYTIAFREVFGGGCFSTVQTFTVPDITPTLEITTSSSPDFSCNTTGTGSLTVTDVKQNGTSESLSDFSYIWYRGIGTSGEEVADVRTTLDTLSSDNYTVVITDNDGDGLGCTYTKTVFLNNVPKVLAISDFQTDPNTLCTGVNGQISITEISEDGIALPNTDDYLFSLQDDAGNPATSTGGDGHAATPFTGLAAGTYYVLAENNNTGCSILSPPITIDTDTYEPVISLEDEYPDFSCAGGDFTGMLEVSVRSDADGDTDASNFQFVWYAGTDTTTPSIGSGTTLNNLAAGQYSVVVTDMNGLSNGCDQTSIFEVLPGTRDINFTVSGIDPTYCVPANGEINVQTIEESYVHNGSTVVTSTNVTDYAYTLLDADLNVMVSNDPDGEFDGLDEGEYFVQAQNINTDNCLSDLVGVSLISQCTPPEVTVNLESPQYSNNPDPSTWTGTISIDVMESPDNPVDSATNNFTYSYEVYEADPVGNPIMGAPNLNPENNTTVTGLNSGNYVIIVRNNETGAVTTSSFNLPKVDIEPEFIAQGHPQTVCFPDGSISLQEVTFNDTQDDPAKYTYYLYENSSLTTIADSAQVAQNGDTLFEDIAQGSYYVQIRHDAYWLYSEIFEVKITNTSQPPRIDLDINNLFPQISCQPEVIATGRLAVIALEVDGTSDEYQYQWYRGNTTVAENIIPGATAAILDSIPSGFYTVEVQNVQTRCIATRTFYVEDRFELPLVEVESEPSTVCDPTLANGLVRAKVIQNGNYTFEWYRGEGTSGLPEHIGSTWGGLTPGSYTVVATDMITGTCSSLPVSVAVEDASEIPQVAIEKLADNTACDPELVNGSLAANVPFPVSDYEYKWFDTAGNLIGEESRIGSLAEGRYTLEVKYLPTGCINTTETEVELSPIQYAPPTVSIHAHMTNCAFPDGSATAYMYENNETVLFSWFDEAGNALTDDQIVINENDLSSTAINLSAGTYFVEAFDLITGCTIPQAIVEIEDHSYAAQHQIEASPATCELTDGKLKVIPQESMTILNVNWSNLNTGQTFESNYQLSEAPAGEYTYEITWENGCTSYGNALLPATINVFNGVSPNGDGDNDVFHIDCIDQFPNNSVKIFNRSGALIYEAKGYDNRAIFFDGYGNRGLYIGNKELPDGTYFYVIEKNNGQKPVTGYLELFR
ncbi:gliding motility-associated C-terminal domain-containing protein [Catalinimonas sp. 4WD22]|uniref:T9SS type B sorting domain-containing protein n=1 Tax=Catalinimonas locisalis TaxID=3133978 RepID=UPI003100B8D0